MRFESVRGRRGFLRGAAACAACGALGLRAGTASANSLRVGAPAPPASLMTLEGRRIDTPELLGSVVILAFWATWCTPCREELPLLSEYASENAPRGLEVLGFCANSADELPQVRAVANTLSFPVGLLALSSAPGYGRIWRLPVNFTIGRDGRLVDDGWRARQPEWTRERLQRLVAPLLESAPNA